METEYYYRNIYYNPHITLRAVISLIKTGVETGQDCYFEEPLFIQGILEEEFYYMYFYPRTMELVIKWESEGEEGTINHESRIQILKEKSNLPFLHGASVYYFVCPRMGVKCRTLYKVGSSWLSRRGLNSLYPSQMASKKDRLHSEEPYRKGGKAYYRGKITPYGKRCERYEAREAKRAELFIKAIEQTYKKYK